MKKLLKGHSEAVLVFFAVVFIVVIVAYLYETIQVVVSQVNQALARPTIAPAQGFDLGSVKKVDFKGLINASGTVSEASPIPPPAAPVTHPAPVTTAPPSAPQPSSTAGTSAVSTAAIAAPASSTSASTSSDLTAPTGTAQ